MSAATISNAVDQPTGAMVTQGKAEVITTLKGKSCSVLILSGAVSSVPVDNADRPQAAWTERAPGSTFTLAPGTRTLIRGTDPAGQSALSFAWS